VSAVDIVIVNWNAGEQVADCVRSVVASPSFERLAARIVVVDNGSTDGSDRNLERLDPRVEVVRNDENRGFAAACNQGARVGSSRFVLFLNPDTRFLSDALGVAVTALDSDLGDEVGVVGVQLVDAAGVVQRTCARFPRWGSMVARSFGLDRFVPSVFRPHFLTEWDHSSDADVDEVMGAFFFVRRDLFESLQGFDERFFVYYEEVDFCYRAALQRRRTRFLSGAQVFHRGGGTTDQVRALRLFFSVRSRLLYAFKHFGRVRGSAVLAASILVEPVVRSGWCVGRRKFDELEATVRGYVMCWKSVIAGDLFAR
jgi:N-acetylglucosaminyl-diphospho-decaprenol L-rhamnosyltransferase